MNNIDDIAKLTIERYSQRYKKLGYDVKTLGWGTKEQQDYRFLQTLDSNIVFENKKVLDIGCGFGDYFTFLNNNHIMFDEYIGYDINPDLISESQKLHTSNRAKFEVENILISKKSNIANIGLMFGVLNLNFKDKVDNYEYSKNFIKKAFALVDEVLIVDFLSTKVTENYQKEDFVFYHSPEKMLEFAFTLSSNVVLKHNYHPIPQKEFMLFIFKD